MNAENDMGPENPEADKVSIDSSPPTSDESESTGEQPLPLATCVRWMVLGEKTVASLFLLVIVSTMAAQVFARYVFNDPFQWSEEVARLALIWMTFISAAFVMAEGRHIAVDMISSRVGDGGKLFIECMSYVVVAVTCLFAVHRRRQFCLVRRQSRIASFGSAQELVVRSGHGGPLADGRAFACESFSGVDDR